MWIIKRIIALIIVVYGCTGAEYAEQISLAPSTKTCTAPLQPQNGHWQLHRMQCESRQDCDILEGMKLPIGSRLIYSCNQGYKIRGSSNVNCSFEGVWIDIPVCIEIRCKPLNTVSTRCSYLDTNGMEWVSCDSPVLPKTRARLSCRNLSYRRESNLFSMQTEYVKCSENGQWEPEPTRCVLVCGKVLHSLTPLVVDHVSPNITEFPWHASMYMDLPNEPKKYFCGASIIKENLLITAAHCVYEDNIRQITNNDIYVVTGNLFRDYDSAFHDPRFVRKNKVKNIYIMCNYLGLVGNYLSDIAILELVEPFELTAWLVPICIDPFSDRFVLEAGASGRVAAGFGRTRGFGRTGDTSAVLQSIIVPYIPFNQCKSASQNASTEQFITNDKFCTGYTNGSAVCDPDSGGGLVFKDNNLWYLRGIVSVSLSTIKQGGTVSCNPKSYTLYTRIFNHIGWIQDVITRLERNQPVPTCEKQERTSISDSRPEQTLVTPGLKICKAPSQPPNGHWQLHRMQCESRQDCDIPEGMELPIGSHLIYSCNQGYKIRGSSDVSCNFEGVWINIPFCIEIRCKSLSTVSTEALCLYLDESVSCGSPVLPRTRAILSCRNSYRRETSLLSNQREDVRCGENGQWEPEPIRCIPACGKVPPSLTPLVVDGVTPNLTEFPWHASMYMDLPNEPKKYFCGASIIKENLLMTAAHCVYEDNIRQITNNDIYVVTGNFFRDYDSAFHDPHFVKKNKVKNIYIICNYLGLVGNYRSDIAILELVEPFELRTWLVPICIDPFSDRRVLEAGVSGRVAGFGRTRTGDTSAVLQSITVPYIPFNQCKSASQNASTEQFITNDKFCAGYTNGSAVCDGDSGGGLVFKTNNLWYLRGIVSVSLSKITQGGTHHCNPKSYSLYTQVFNHIRWIQYVIARLEQNQPIPSCEEQERF